MNRTKLLLSFGKQDRGGSSSQEGREEYKNARTKTFYDKTFGDNGDDWSAKKWKGDNSAKNGNSKGGKAKGKGGHNKGKSKGHSGGYNSSWKPKWNQH